MILITGPAFSGKTAYAQTLSNYREAVATGRLRSDVQELAANCSTAEELTNLADQLVQDCEILLLTDIGGGIVPVDAAERHAREQAGKLAVLLAERADTVVRICCGLPDVLKGKTN